MDKKNCFNLGYIARRVGNHGELGFVLDVDDGSRYNKLESIFIELNNSLVPFFIKRIQVKGCNATVSLEGIDSIERAEELLKKSYRIDGWSAQQIFHHIADSHSNALTRIKLALTEHNPIIKPYNQDAWAVLADVDNVAIEVSLKMIEAIHIRWLAIINAMSETDFSKKYIHPEYKKEFRLDEFIALYAWHGKHHYGQLNTILNNG